MRALALVPLTARERAGRLAALAAFAALFLIAAGIAALIARDAAGHVNTDRLFRIGGLPLTSGLLFFGWVLGRFPLIAVLVLMAGIVSRDREEKYLRLYAVRPISPLAVYGIRWLSLALLAFALSAVLLPLFDVIMLGEWAGPATFVLIAAYIAVYGGLTALLSVWTRGDVWIALLLAVAAMVWHALLEAGTITIVPVVAEFVSFVLPPRAAIFALEGAFGDIEPIPWGAFAYAIGYGAVMLLLAGVSLAWRER